MRSLATFKSSLGNILEWYDFGLFTVFSTILSQQFFPTEKTHTAIIYTLGILAAGFLCRPLGALIFGYLGDRRGRLHSLRLSILMIALPTFCIGLLPSYHQIGLLAPILLMIARMWQGISIGGQYSGSIICLAESAPSKYRATYTAFANMSANIGILLAAAMSVVMTRLLSAEALYSWGWRVPYILSGIIYFGIYFANQEIHETAVFFDLKQKNLITKKSFYTLIKTHLPQVLVTLGLVCMGSTFYGFCFIYLPIYLHKMLSFSIQNISTYILFSMLLMIFIAPFGGFLCDKFGRRTMFMLNATIITMIVIPGFYLLQIHNGNVLLFVLLAFTVVSALEQGTTGITLVENFPANFRYTGVSLGYNLGNGLLGGTVPFACQWLQTSDIYLGPALYITLCALITGFVCVFWVPETLGKSLKH